MTGFSYELGVGELKRNKAELWKALLAEFLGIFLLNFFSCGACTQSGEDGTFKALAFGLSVFTAVMSIGHVSGGHINPAVTAGMLAAGKISLLKAVLYIIVQCLGAIAGTASLKALLDTKYQGGLGHTSLAPDVLPVQGVGIEFFLGFVLVLTVFGVCDENKPDSKIAGPLAIGLAVTLGHLGTIRYTGASMNPARTVGTAVITSNWENHWVYWVGPVLGGIGAALLYTSALTAPKPLDLAKEKYETVADARELRKLDRGSDYA